MATSKEEKCHSQSILSLHYNRQYEDDGINKYFEIWAKFDSEGSETIRFQQLSELLEVLDPPLQIRKPNKFKIVFLDVPIHAGDLVKSGEVLDCLILDCFARDGNAIDDMLDSTVIDEPMSSSMWRQREEYAARVIQTAWRKHATCLGNEMLNCTK